MSFMSRFGPHTYAILRIATGFLFLWHGSQKLLGFPPSSHDAPALILYVAGPIELVGGVLIMLGLFTRYAAFLCSGLMCAAYFMAHASRGLLPIQNGGEMATLYAFLFLFISAHGSGIWSIDGRRSKD